MNRLIIRRNINLFSIAIFLTLFALINYIRPHFLYNDDGSLRNFGVGYRRKTVIPGWFVAIILAIFCRYNFVKRTGECRSTSHTR